eukprot:TRINITY_DN37261_c0_g1_i1.p1 TRINITY_DN37261_c0_g1~~TRINITY_DN37261_c0_g1_i1.p1  ORF type:complete len:440 (+),score=148.42 TRINITY_DN37261_c0_g1_i1:82-1320(+)
MGKRAAPKAASPSKAKVARKMDEDTPKQATPRKSEEGSLKVPQVDDEFAKTCRPVLDLINLDSELSEECREMLTAMTPFCLKGGVGVGGAPHKYQERMSEVLQKLAADVEASRKSALEAAETRLAELGQQQENSGSVTAAAEAAETAARAVRDESDKVMKSAVQAVEEAEKKLQEAKDSAERVEMDRSVLVAEKLEYEEIIAQQWAELKAGSMAGNWRERNRTIDGLLEVLEKTGLDESLSDSLPVALKTKPADRGAFAERTVAFAEELLQKHVASLGEKLDGFEGEASTRSKAVEDAKAAVEESKKEKSQSQEKFIEAENFLLEKTTALTEAKSAQQSFGPKKLEAASALDEAKTSLEEVRGLIARFDQLRNPQKEVVTEAATEAVTEAVPQAASEAAPEAAPDVQAQEQA